MPQAQQGAQYPHCRGAGGAQVVSAETSSGSLQGGQLTLPGNLGNVLYSAAAGAP